jgi:2-keto-3-deoxy-L-rhamnonate aldolase RhmA
MPAQERLQQETKYGGWVALPSLISVEALARAGMDFVTLDLQHGTLDFHDAAAAIQLLDVLGVESLVRVSAAELPSVSRYLDFGVSGVIVAVVESAAIAATAIAAARYQPEGKRSYGGQRYGLRAEPSNVRSLKPTVYAMIETAGGVDDLDAIAATPGLAGLFVGPADLALALGEQPGHGPESRRWQDVITRVLALGRSHHLETGMVAGNGEEAAMWASRGFNRVVIGSDVGLLRQVIAYELARARGASDAPTSLPRGSTIL